MKTDNPTLLDNYREFKNQLPTLLEEHEGEYAVFHNCELSKVFEQEYEALSFARTTYKIGEYIVQEIHNRTSQPASYSLLI